MVLNPGVLPDRDKCKPWRIWLSKIRGVYRFPVKGRETPAERDFMEDLLKVMTAACEQRREAV